MENNIDYGYLDLLQDIMDNGVQKGDRTGTGTRSVFGRQIRHDMSLGFPLLTTKEINFQNIKSELAWFLSGSSDIRDLWKNRCFIWDGDWYKNYCKTTSSPYSLREMRKFGLDYFKTGNTNNFHESTWSLGPIYGVQWKDFGGSYTSPTGRGKISSGGGIDQIQELLDTLQNNPDSRRMIVNAWNVEVLDDMTLPPCHYGFQVYTRELNLEERARIFNKRNKHLHDYNIDGNKDGIDLEEKHHIVFDNNYNVPKRSISLIWIQRSVDTPLGLPYNIASYGLLLEMLADEFNMVPGELIGQLGDVHIYNNQFEGVKEQLSRKPGTLPRIEIQDGMESLLVKESNDIILEGYNPQPNIKFPLSN